MSACNFDILKGLVDTPFFVCSGVMEWEVGDHQGQSGGTDPTKNCCIGKEGLASDRVIFLG